MKKELEPKPYHSLLCRIAANEITLSDTFILQRVVSSTRGFPVACLVNYHIELGAKLHYGKTGAYGKAAAVYGCAPSTAERAYVRYFCSARSTNDKRNARQEALI